jgi:ribosomal protein L37AE/L43A
MGGNQPDPAVLPGAFAETIQPAAWPAGSEGGDKMTPNRRMRTRDRCDAPVSYTHINEHAYHHARMGNISPGGIYFTSDRHLTRGAQLYIRIKDVSAGLQRPYPNAFVAQVRWEKPVSGLNRYGVGLSFLSRGHVLPCDQRLKAHFTCDLCGSTLDDGVHETPESIYLCPKCFQRYGSLGGTMLQGSLSRFMIGNVL